LPKAPSLELVESWPSETSLDDPLIRDAAVAWVDLIDSARERIDISEFYAKSAPNSALERVIAALLRAADRGVRVRMIVDTKLLGDNHEVPERLEAHPKIEVRRYDLGAIMGGVQHAKYFVVDDELAYLGSQNFDYRSLEHILELGVVIRVRPVVDALRATFEDDWRMAAGEPRSESKPFDACASDIEYGGKPVRVCAALSPKGFLIDEALWDLPRLLQLIGEARKTITVQLLDYATVNYDRSSFTELDDALRSAAARGVHIRMMVADWSKRAKSLEPLQALQRVPNIDVRFVTIPPHSSGFIPHARVIHAKAMVVDGLNSWVGTSNWSGDYFYKSRNVGIVVEGASFAQDVARFFETTWDSNYAYDLDPDAKYEPPRIKE
jgi:phosphatidylserine/phosphatidylglycerophosphate/cardiolipin synthase-like enzyme